MALHAFGSDVLLPDRSFLLTLSAQAAARRLARRDTAGTDRMGSKPGDYQMRLAARFAELAAAEPARWRVIDADADAETVPAAITAELEPRSEERRVGQGGGSTCRSRWSPYP